MQVGNRLTASPYFLKREGHVGLSWEELLLPHKRGAVVVSLYNLIEPFSQLEITFQEHPSNVVPGLVGTC